MLDWLLESGIGPAAVALPVTWAGEALADAAKRWFRRFRRADDLSRLVSAAAGTSVNLSPAGFSAVRRLLEDPRTWNLAGRGTVEDLAGRIASCLPPSDGWLAEDSHLAAMAIARGLLEFTVADLDPKLFQQLLLARLQRMESGQANALDEALLDLNAALVTRFSDVMQQFKRVLDRLPAAPAHRGEVVVYLQTLIDWLNIDPWPRDRRFGGPSLTPAALERKLRVITPGKGGEYADADCLAGQSRRLVILGPPGSGKTWLARRTVRLCAESALEALAAGATLEEIELPLYTTCSRLFGAGGGIREAVVSSALDQIGDLGGSRISAALHRFFTERNAPTVLVVDSLDEASGSDERLRQADTLPWRILLTSRPSSWNDQLAIDDKDPLHQVGDLQPLRYPDDVEPFIERWFTGRPEWANELASQIARRPNLQQATTVPLILAFFCIVGGGEPLPEFRRDLYTRVLSRIITGRWRGSGDRRPDVRTCLQTLRAWAWSGAASHPVSGIGAWPEDIATESGQLDASEEDAVNHVAVPTAPPDLDTGRTMRRFIHRSIREHLVAEHISSLSIDQAVNALLPHCWHDADWEYSAPAAIAMHPQRNQLLQQLICRAARSDQLPGNLSTIDAVLQIRGLLARVASESNEADWEPGIAEMISQAQVEMVLYADPGWPAHWRTANRQACDALLEQLTRRAHGFGAKRIVDRLAQAAPTGEDKRLAREALLRLLSREDYIGEAAELGRAISQLDPTVQDRRQACDALIGHKDVKGTGVAWLADVLAELTPSPEDRRLARDALLRLLAGPADVRAVDALTHAVAELAPAPEDKHHARDALLALLPGETDSRRTRFLILGVIQFAPTAEDKRQARGALLRLLAGQTDSLMATVLAEGVIWLAPTAQEKRQARRALLQLLAGQPGSHAAGLATKLARLDPTAEDKHQAREVVLKLLAAEADNAAGLSLAEAAVVLADTTKDKQRSFEILLTLLSRQTNPIVALKLVRSFTVNATAAEDKQLAREATLRFIAHNSTSSAARFAARNLSSDTDTAEDKRQARGRLLQMLTSDTGAPAAALLAEALIQLGPTNEEKRLARGRLLQMLTSDTGAPAAALLAETLIQLESANEDKQPARSALLGLLARETDSQAAAKLAGQIAALAPTDEDRRQAHDAMLKLLHLWPDRPGATELACAIAQLAVTHEEKRLARDTMLGMSSRVDKQLMYWLARLDPPVQVLSDWQSWADQPTDELLAAARRNSPLTAWLAALPSLAPLCGVLS